MPPRDSHAYLWDVVRSARLIREFTLEKTFEDYERDVMLRSAVERQFEIISFRNLLIHAYMTVDPAVVWGTVVEDLPILLREAEALLNQDDDNS